MSAILTRFQIKRWLRLSSLGFATVAVVFLCVHAGPSQLLAAQIDAVERPAAPVSPPFPAAASDLIQASCIDCHDSTDNGPDFTTLGTDLSNKSNFRQWTRIYDRVQHGEMPPNTEPRPDADLQSNALVAIEQALTAENHRFQSANGRVILRRLTRLEYENSINDLLHINSEIRAILPAENTSTSYDTVFTAQGFSPLHIKSYLEAADIALDQALRLENKPESITKRFEYLENKFVRRHIDEPEGRVVIGETDRGVIMFNTASYLFKIDHHLHDSGWYKIRAKASAYQSDGPVILTLNAGDYSRGFTKMLGFFDLTSDKPIEVEVEAYLEQGQYIFPGAEDLQVQPDGKTIWNVGPEEFAGAGIELEWLEVEGPRIDQWPPLSTTNLFKDIEIAALPKTRWDAQRQTHLAYELKPSDDTEAQLRAIVAWLAPRAFRRPMVQGEATPFVELGMSSISNGGTFEDAVRVACRAILTSPQFLFMTAEPGKLDEYSLASRLSYFFWKSMPDEELFQLARDGDLSQPETLRAQVERMLDDPKAERFVQDFTNQWLQLTEIDATAPDANLYPEFDERLKWSMLQETRQFFAHLIKHDLSISQLIDSDFVFVNRRLAEHYDLPPIAGQQLQKVRLEADSVRGGLITQASVLKVTANGTTTSPVRRGSWVLSHLLGTPPNPPPPSVGSIEPDTRGATTIRELLEKHRDDTSCASCHRKIDPPGFALECFDVIGGYRERFRSRESGDRPTTKLLGRNIWEYKLGLPVDASGELASGQSFNGIAEYKRLLANEKEQVARNLLSQLAIYGTGAELQFADRAAIESILEECRESDFGLRRMIHQLVQSKLFLEK